MEKRVEDAVGRAVPCPLGTDDAWWAGCSDCDPVTVGRWLLLDGMTLVCVAGTVACVVGATDDELKGDSEDGGWVATLSAGVGRGEAGPVDVGDRETGSAGLGCTDTVGDAVDGTIVLVRPVGDPDERGVKELKGGKEVAVVEDGITEGTPARLGVFEDCGG